MKKIIFMLTLGIFFSASLFAQNKPPEITNVHAQQRAGTKFVDITYDLLDADGDTVIVFIEVSGNGGRTFPIIPLSISGDVGEGIIPGMKKSIVWDAGKDYPGQYGTDFQIRIIAYDEHGAGITVNDGYGDYVFVPAGEFMMGDNFYERGGAMLPVHRVNLNAYYIGKYEVTNAEYKRFMDDKGYTTQSYWEGEGYGKFGAMPLYWTDPKYRGGGIAGNENFPVLGGFLVRSGGILQMAFGENGEDISPADRSGMGKSGTGD